MLPGERPILHMQVQLKSKHISPNDYTASLQATQASASVAATEAAATGAAATATAPLLLPSSLAGNPALGTRK